MPIELKICGINSENTINTIIKNGGCKYLGFVFYPSSKRNLSIKKSKELISMVPKNIKKVAVLVNPDKNFVEKIKNQFDYLQLYNTSPSKIKELRLVFKKKIIQAIKVQKEEDIETYKKYIGIVDEFLFDSAAMEKSFSFNWNYLKNRKSTHVSCIRIHLGIPTCIISIIIITSLLLINYSNTCTVF